MANLQEFKGLIAHTTKPRPVYKNENGNRVDNRPPEEGRKRRNQKYNKVVDIDGEEFNLYDFLGVYEIYYKGKLEYIGRATVGDKEQSLAKTLFRHFTPYNFEGENAPYVYTNLMGEELTFNVYIFENDPDNAEDIGLLEAALILEKDPPENKNLKPEVGAAQYSSQREAAGYAFDKPDTANVAKEIGELAAVAELGDQEAQQAIDKLDPDDFTQENAKKVLYYKEKLEADFNEVVADEELTRKEQKQILSEVAQSVLDNIANGQWDDEVPF